MSKKLLTCSIILIISISLLNISYATDTSINSNGIDLNTITSPDGNTIYSPNSDLLDTDDSDIDDENITIETEDYATITTTDYDDGADLSISNIINIILISVGIVLILLGIAIIIKLK